MRDNASPAAPALRQDRANVLAIEGDIDLHISPAITEALNAMIKKKPDRIVIDLSRATYIDSAGVAALMLAKQDIEAYGGKFFLSGVQETIRAQRRIQTIAQATSLFHPASKLIASKRWRRSPYPRVL